MAESALASLAATAPANGPVAAEERAALAVARGICRLFARNDIWCLAEMPLRNGRRADLMGVDAKGRVVIVEIKVCDWSSDVCSSDLGWPRPPPR